MRIPKVNLGKYLKSYGKTQKVIRTISRQKPYIHKQEKQEAEIDCRINEYLAKQKQMEKDISEKLDNALINTQTRDISYYKLLLYSIKSNRVKNRKTKG